MLRSSFLGKVWPRQITKRICLSTVIIIIFPMLTLAIVTALHYFELEKEQRGQELYTVTSQLNDSLPTSYKEILARHGALDKSAAEQVNILNSELQPVVNTISKLHPGVSAGYYSLDLDRIVAVGPNFDSSFLKAIPHNKTYFQAKTLGKPKLEYSLTSFLGQETPVLNLTFPLYRDGKIIGHAWADIKLKDMFLDIFSKAGSIIIVGILIILALIFLSGSLAKNLSRELSKFANAIMQNNTYDVQDILPELSPILGLKHEYTNKLHLKNEELRSEVQERFRIEGELRKYITEHKKFEKEMARFDKLNLLGEMAAGISHEVRNPMTTVRGFLQILSNKTDCQAYKTYFILMIEELDRANSIITEFLSVGKNTTETKKYQNLNLIIGNLVPLIQADALSLDKYVRVELNDIPYLILNESEIRQIVLNLARNGLEAMPEGGHLIISTYREGDEVVLSVQDEGRGIAPEDLEKLGTPFFTTKNNGTGLGLAVCYGIASRHNANIKIKTGDKGTTFNVHFKINHGEQKTYLRDNL